MLALGVILSLGAPFSASAVGPVATCTAVGTYGYYFPPSSNPGDYLYLDGRGSCLGGQGPYSLSFVGRGIECLSIDVIMSYPCDDFAVQVTTTLTNVVTGNKRTLRQVWTSVAHLQGPQPFVITPKGGAGIIDIGGSSYPCDHPYAESECISATYVFSFVL